MLRLKFALCTLIFSCFFLNAFAATAKLHQILGSKNLDILKNAQFVTMLEMPPGQSSPETHLSNNDIERLKRQLLDDHNYAFNISKPCTFTAELSFKFQNSNGEIAHLFISPRCNQILFTMESDSFLLNYDPAHDRLEPYFEHLAKEVRMKTQGKEPFAKL